MKLNKYGFINGNNSIFHICGCKTYEHLMNITMDIKFVYRTNINDDEKKIMMNLILIHHAHNHTFNHLNLKNFEGVLSSLTIKDLKKKIEIVMDIKIDEQILYQLKIWKIMNIFF